MIMAWPQLTLIVLMALSLGIMLSKHGEPKTGYESFWVSLTTAAFEFWLLYEGGFFSAILK
jgi:hypothetical protein